MNWQETILQELSKSTAKAITKIEYDLERIDIAPINPIEKTNIEELVKNYDFYKQKNEEMKAYTPDKVRFDMAMIKKEISREFDGDKLKAVSNIRTEFDMKIKALEKSKEDKIEIAQTAYNNAEAIYQNSLSGIKAKLAVLARQAPEVKGLAKLYGLMIPTEKISFEGKSISEILDFLNTVQQSLEYIFRGENKVSYAISYLYDPITRNKFNLPYAAAHLSALILIFIFQRPFPLAIIGTLFLIHTYLSKKEFLAREELIKLFLRLSNGIKVPEDQTVLSLLRELEEVKNLDLSPGKERLMQERAELINKVETDSATVSDLEKFESENLTKIQNEIMKANNRVMELYQNALELSNENFREISTIINDIADAFVPLGKKVSGLDTQSFNLITGHISREGRVIGEVSTPRPSINRIYCSRDNSTREILTKQLQFDFFNLISAVKPKQSIFRIFDPYQSRELDAFINFKGVEFTSNETEFNKWKVSYNTEMQSRRNLLRNLSIEEYNKMAVESKKATLNYHIYIILSDDKLLKESTFLNFLQSSAGLGIIFWVTTFQKEDGNKEGFVDAIRNNSIYKDKVVVLDRELFIKSSIAERYTLEDIDIAEYSNIYNEAYKRAAGSTVMYFSDVHPVAFKSKDVMLKKSATYGVEFSLGFPNDDRTQVNWLKLDDASPHGFITGGTGSGKSECTNTALNTICAGYTKNEVELYLIDLKNAEFKFFGKNPWPNIKVIAGATDPSYLISVTQYLVSLIGSESRDYLKEDVKDLKSYNAKMESIGSPERKKPRRILWIEEWNVVNVEESVPGKLRSILMGNIEILLRQGRSLGIHCMFVAQSAGSAFPAELWDQISLRICARVASEVEALTMIGTLAPMEIRDPHGWCYSNSQAGKLQNSTTLWRSPYNGQGASEIVKTQSLVNEIMKERNLPAFDGIVYDEMTPYYPSEIKKHLQNPEFKNLIKENSIILGEKCIYTLYNEPVVLNVGYSADSHIQFISENMKKQAMFIRTIMTNCHELNYDYLICTKTEQLIEVGNFSSVAREQSLALVDPTLSQTEVVEALTELLEARRTADVKLLKPMFVIIGAIEDWQFEPYNRQFEALVKSFVDASVSSKTHLVVTGTGDANKLFQKKIKHWFISDSSADVAYSVVGDARPAQKLFKNSNLMLGNISNDVKTIKMFEYELTETQVRY